MPRKWNIILEAISIKRKHTISTLKVTLIPDIDIVKIQSLILALWINTYKILYKLV